MHDLEKIQKALLKAGMDDIILQKYNAEESMLKFVDNKIVKRICDSYDSLYKYFRNAYSNYFGLSGMVAQTLK